MNPNNITLKTQEAIQRAQQIAFEHGHQSIEVGHLLKGILEVDQNVTPFIFKKLSVNINIVRQAVDAIIKGYPKVQGGNPYLSRYANEVMQRAATYLKEFGDEYIALEHLLLSILRVKDPVSQLLKDSGINEKDLKAAIKDLRKGSKVTSHSAEDTYNALNKYAVNLNEKLMLDLFL